MIKNKEALVGINLVFEDDKKNLKTIHEYANINARVSLNFPQGLNVSKGKIQIQVRPSESHDLKDKLYIEPLLVKVGNKKRVIEVPE